VLRETFTTILKEIPAAAFAVYGDRLVSLAVFGSVGRGVPRFDSDIDLLVVATGLSRRRLRRVEEFAAVEELLAPALSRAAVAGVKTALSPVFKTPAEVQAGSLLFLDMVEDARLLYDRDGFLAGFLIGLRERLQALGARRVRRGGAWYWLVKGEYNPGEVFEI
jgi:predicted nucleotidyltransferase